MNMPEIVIKRGREKPLRNRHPWVFSGAVYQTRGKPRPGDLVRVLDGHGESLGVGYHNASSQIVVRMLTFGQDDLLDVAREEAFWRGRLEAAIARRSTLRERETATAYRLVFAESDGVPGLIVDRYGDWLVLQALTLGIDRRKAMLAAILGELVEARGVFERSDVDVRPREGLEPAAGPLWGEMPPKRIEISEHGARFVIDVMGGQKTGFYLDQRESRACVARYCKEARVLNAFSYTGGFAVYAGLSGALSVTNLDASQDALDVARENWRLNSLPEDGLREVAGDAFKAMRRMRDRGEQYDVVILDPPKFAFSRAQVRAASRGYKDINMLGMKLLRPGGTLATFSCSGAIDADLFQKIVFGASADVGRDGRILERLSQPADHAVLLSFPESTYLKGLVCEMD